MTRAHMPATRAAWLVLMAVAQDAEHALTPARAQALVPGVPPLDRLLPMLAQAGIVRATPDGAYFVDLGCLVPAQVTLQDITDALST